MSTIYQVIYQVFPCFGYMNQNYHYYIWYPLVIWNSHWNWQFIVGFPLKTVIFHSYVSHYQRINPIKTPQITFPWNHHFPMFFLSYGFPMKPPFSYGFPFQWFSHSTTIFLWFSYGFPMKHYHFPETFYISSLWGVVQVVGPTSLGSRSPVACAPSSRAGAGCSWWAMMLGPRIC